MQQKALKEAELAKQAAATKTEQPAAKSKAPEPAEKPVAKEEPSKPKKVTDQKPDSTVKAPDS